MIGCEEVKMSRISINGAFDVYRTFSDWEASSKKAGPGSIFLFGDSGGFTELMGRFSETQNFLTYCLIFFKFVSLQFVGIFS